MSMRHDFAACVDIAMAVMFSLPCWLQVRACAVICTAHCKRLRWHTISSQQVTRPEKLLFLALNLGRCR